MNKKLVIMSGKGGSGKTSLSLAFSKAIANSGLKVLLVDCDMSTHGATFFMKPYIEKHRNDRKKVVSVDDLLLSHNMPPYGFFTSSNNNIDSENKYIYDKMIMVEKNFYFIPSDISISNSKENQGRYVYDTFDRCFELELEDVFDIIIFDCQAGYSDFTRHIVQKTDMCILITEPDSVSAAANRALCFQLGVELQNIQIYQLFNKITEEESEYYSKIATSAFFSNLLPVTFNWAVRKTFVFRQIPSTESVDFYFGKRVVEVLLVLFPEYKDYFKKHREKIYSVRKKSMEIQLRKAEEAEKKKKKKYVFSLIISVMACIALIAGFILTLREISDISIKFMLGAMVSCAIGCIVLLLSREKTQLDNLEDKVFELLYDWDFEDDSLIV